MRAGAERHLYDEATGRFARSVRFDKDGHAERDLVVDASLSALAYFGMFDADDARIIETMATVKARLWVAGEHGGLARFEGDTYQLRQTAADVGVPGNPWFLCTMWLAQYQLMRALTLEDLEEPLRLIEQVARCALPSGALAEQTDPASGEPAGATPLTWAHGTAIQTILEYVAARERLEHARAPSSPDPDR
jgi:GH15 family glucan-1,4-alpha-glucosidase